MCDGVFAFACGLHPRLGAESPVASLPKWVAMDIVVECRKPEVWIRNVQAEDETRVAIKSVTAVCKGRQHCALFDDVGWANEPVPTHDDWRLVCWRQGELMVVAKASARINNVRVFVIVSDADRESIIVISRTSAYHSPKCAVWWGCSDLILEACSYSGSTYLPLYDRDGRAHATGMVNSLCWFSEHDPDAWPGLHGLHGIEFPPGADPSPPLPESPALRAVVTAVVATLAAKGDAATDEELCPPLAECPFKLAVTREDRGLTATNVLKSPR